MTDKDEHVLEVKQRKLNNRNQSQSINIPPKFKAYADLKESKFIEIKTVRDPITNALYLEVRLLKEKEVKKNEQVPTF